MSVPTFTVHDSMLNFCSNFGIAAITAYRAYNDSSMLAAAEVAWNTVAPFQITQEQATSGQNPSRSFDFDGLCGTGD
jgi:hypothetical protein